MLIFLYGPDDYRREQKKREIIAEFRKKRSDLGLGIFDFEADGDTESVRAFLRNVSMFEPKKLAVIENIFPSRRGKFSDDGADTEEESSGGDVKSVAALLKEYADAKDTTILASTRKKPVKAFQFLLKEPSRAQEFEVLTGSAWESFINGEAKKNDLALTPDAAKVLAAAYQGDSWGLATELEKLSAFKKTLNAEDLEEFDFDAAPNYWALVNGAKHYDMRMRLAALERLFAMNDPAPKIFNILTAQWPEKISQAAAYDLAVKSGKLEYEEALVDMVL